MGVCTGSTFNNINVPFKIAVDPVFRFDIDEYKNENTHFYAQTSDDFFKDFIDISNNLKNKYDDKTFKFDIIYLDGLHTFEQTLRDFENTLKYSHDKTVWVFDDTLPCHFFSSLDSQDYASKLRKLAGLSCDNSWHGDVYKVIFHIHDEYPEFSYCTQYDNGNPQTILWKTDKVSSREKVFNNINKSISQMSYEDFINYAWTLYPVVNNEVIDKIYKNINPIDYKDKHELKNIIKPIKTDKEIPNDIVLNMAKPYLKFTYLRYRLLSEITFGKKRQYYKNKKFTLKKLDLFNPHS